MLTTVAASATQHTGWGNPLALILTALLFWAAISGHRRWKQVKNHRPALPPAKTRKAIDTVKPQVKADSDSDIEPSPAGGGEVVPLHRKPIDDFIAANVGSRPATAIVRDVVEKFGVSESSAWRALRPHRNAKDGAA